MSSAKMSNKVFTNIVSVVTALSLVFLQVPVIGWHSQAMADATDAAQEQLAANAAVDVPLTFENAYITYAGQVIAPPASKVTIPGAAAMEFTAEADSGYQVESVTATIDGTDVELSPDAAGVYRLTAADVVMTSNLAIVAITAPTVEQTAAEEAAEAQATEAETAAASEAADGAEAAPAATGNAAEADAQSRSSEAAKATEAVTAEATEGQLENTNPDFTYSDDDVTVTAKLSQANAVPADAVFQVKHVTSTTEGYNYDVYMAALNESADGVEYTPENTLLYDIAFMVPKTDGAGNVVEGEFVEYEPTAGTVAVSIEFKKNQLSDALDAEKAADLEIAHLPLSSSVLETVDSTEDATNIYVRDVTVESVEGAAANVDAEKVSFTTDSLSVYSVSAANAQLASASASLGAAAVVNTVPTSTDLANYLTGATFNAPQNEEGKYVVTEGGTYTFTLAFAESQSLQFPNDGSVMSYVLPAGLDVADGHQGTLNIKVNDGGVFSTVSGNRYWIENGVLYFQFNTADPNFPTLAAASNAKVNMTFSGSIDGNIDELHFKDGISKDIEVDTSNSVSASKSAWVDKANGKVHYTVSVVSKGMSKNVVVKDAITGEALTLDPGSISATSSTGSAVGMTGSARGNSFEYTIGQMKDGEVVTFTYAADIDGTKITKNSQGQYITTGNNSVSVKSDGDPTPDTISRNVTIDYTPGIQKGNGIIVSDNGTTKTLLWTVTANDNPKVSMANGTITDTIANESQSIMKYSGSGIAVDVYDAAGNKVRTDNVSWNNLTNKTDSTWTYTVPSADSGKAYKYVVTYTTEVTVANASNGANVSNGAKVDEGNTSWNGATIPGTGGNNGGGSQTETTKVHVNKTAESVDVANREITWNITFNVPEEGLTSAVVTDQYPNVWANSKTIREAVKEGTVSVTGLKSGESYDVRYGDEAAVITFYQNQGKTTAGLQAGDARVVSVTLKTVIDDEWFESSKTTSWQREHKNNVSINTSAGSSSSSASAYVNDFGLSKSVTAAGYRTVDGFQLPVYKYEVVLENVTSDVNVIDDRFDTSVLEVYDSSQWDSQYVFGGNVYYQGNQASDKFSYVYTADGIRITTSPDTMPHDSSVSSGLYSSYKLVYYLTVKDKTAYDLIMTRAAESEGGLYALTNTAEWNDQTDGAEVTFQYAGLTKEILTPDADLSKADEDIWADFRITLNPSGAMLNGGEPMTMTDTYENLSIDFHSITATPSAGVTWDASGNVVTYTIPDQTKVVITYRARVVFDDNGSVGETKHVRFSNVAEMNGYRGEVNKQGHRTNNGSGSATINAIYLLKYEAGDMTNRLAGATFALLDAGKNPVVDKWGNAVTFTTPEDGRIEIRGDQDELGWTIQEDQRYYLRELVAPEGYQLAGFDYSFQVSSDGTTDYSQYIYHNGDTLTAKNYAGTDVKVNKVWSDGNANHSSDSVTVKLQQKVGDGEWSDVVRMQNVANGWAWEDMRDKTLVLSASNDWSGLFSGLPIMVPESLGSSNADDVAVEYRVVESLVNDKEPERSAASIEAGKDGGTYTYTVTNAVDEKVSVPVSKEWDDNDDQDALRPDAVTVRLLANGQDTGKSAVLNEGNGWSHTFAELDAKDDAGATIAYAVDEDVPAGYSKSIAGSVKEGFTITNAHTPEKIGVNAKKAWSDNDDQDGARPETVTLKLMADGQDTGKTITLSEANGWAAGWTDLDKMSNGKEITYAVQEAGTPSGYTVAYTTEGAVLVASNSHTTEKTSVSVEKVWSDNGNQDGIRPGSVTVNLMADGAKVDSAVLSADNGWKHTFSDLAKKANGKVVNYTVEEDSVPSGYTAAISGTAEAGYKVTNTHTPQKTGVSVVKQWGDADNRDGARPESIQVQLKANGANSGEAVTLSADNNWAYTWTDLDMKAGGVAVVYTVDEVSVPEGYTKVVTGDMQNGFVIENKHENDETSVTVNKEWDDNDNQDGLQKPVAVVLKADGVTQGAAVELNAGNAWTHTWTKLAKNKANEVGQAIVYTVEEVNVPAGYEASVSENKNADGTFAYTVTNAHAPQTTSITGTKDWQDADNQDGKRATAVVLQLNKNGEAHGDPVTVTEADSWSHTWADLPVYENGSLVAYTVTETGTDPDYSVTPGTKDNNYTVTNAYQPGKTTVTVSKVWNDQSDFDGLQPKSIQVQLKADGKASGEPVTLDADNNWTHTWTELDKMSGGKVVDYTIEELEVAGYDVEVTGGRDATSGAFNYTVTNTHTPELTSVSVEKVWQDADNQDGLRVPVTVSLVRSDGVTQAQTLSAANGWKHTWSDLPTVVGGNAVTYSVSEITAIDGYETSMTETDGAYTITNAHTPEKTSAKVTKTWNDGDDQDGKRAATVQLMANTGSDQEDPWVAVGEPVAVGTADTWTYEWTGLDKYEGGKLITYKVVEASAPEGYSANVTRASGDEFEYSIENSYTPEETSVTVTKAWDDGEDHDGLQPSSIQVQLYADNEPSGDPVTLDAANGWTHTWTGLAKKASGEDIAYDVAETKVPGGYAMTKAGGKQEAGTFDYTITNTHVPQYTSASVTKIWNDGDNQDGLRADIQVQLYANGVAYGDAVTLTEGAWSHEWADLPTVIDGKDIVYTVNEVDVPAGYAKAQSASLSEDGSYTFAITNTHTPDAVSIPVTKVWDDEGNKDGARPGEVTVKLLANGADTGKTLTLNEDNSWTGTFADLAKNEDGAAIDYAIQEVAVSGYDVAIAGNAEAGYTVTNTHEVAKTQVSVTKDWQDADDQDGLRPDGVSMQLYANGTAVGQPVTLDAEHGWTHTWTELDKNENGVAITYTVDEATVPDGYGKTAVEGGAAEDGSGTFAYTVTNVHNPAKTEITGTKAWDDQDNQDGKRATSVLLQLNANGTPVGNAVAVTEADGWSHTWTGLDVKANGEDIVYTVTESGADADYSVTPGSASNEYTVTNSYMPGKTSVSVTKVWLDAQNQDGIRPGSIQVQLKADGVAKGPVVTLDAGNSWTHTWTELDEMSNGAAIDYTVEESGVPSGYATEVTGGAEDGGAFNYTITNTHVPDTTEMLVAKAWDDADDQDGLRPDDVSVTLLADGVEKATVQLNEANGWTYRWTDLPANQNGQKITYSLKEVSDVAGYERATVELSSTKLVFKNAHAPETVDIPVTKTWADNNDQDGLREPVQVQLKAGGANVGEAVTLDAGNSWSHIWEDLPVYSGGVKIAYSITEVSVPEGYSSSTAGNAEDGFVITNAHTPATTEKTVVKVWDDAQNQDGVRPSSVTVQLHDDDGAVGDPVTLSDDSGWSYTWENLPVKRAGKTLSYSVSEVVGAGYTNAIADNGQGTFTVTNSYTPGTTTASVTKVWDDGNNRDLTRPASIEVQLKADGAVKETVELNAGNQWHHDWTDLPEKADGKVITYTVEEVTALPAYATATTHDGNAYTITNAYSPETVSLVAQKAWNDDDNRESVRPESATLQLKANGTAVRTLELNEGNGWTESVSDLPKNEAGVAIEYTLDEEDVPEGYTFSFSVGEGGVLVGTNTHEIRTVDIPVKKDWQDADDQDGMRPASITVALLADGQPTGKTLVLNEAGNWEGAFEGLPALNAGNEIAYTLQELEVSGYDSTITGDAAGGFTVTNAHTPVTTQVTGVKAWSDADDQDGLRRDIASVRLQLKADGANVGDPVEVAEADGWSYTWENLPVYKQGAVGQAIVYTVDEADVPAGYTKSVSNELVDGVRTFTIVNAHAPELVDIPVAKVWSDDDDRDGLRPDSVTVNLMNGETIVDTAMLGDENGWAHTFTGLPKYADGAEIAYTVEEAAVEGYTPTVTGTVKDGFTVTNEHSYTPTSKTVRKVWDDADDQDGIRPASIKVQLLDNGGAYGEPVTLDASNDWSYTWDNLPLNYANGVAATYSVSEVVPAGYTAGRPTVGDDGAFVITNSYTPGVTTVSVTKAWNDEGDQDGVRPDSIEVQLKADGEAKEAVELSESNQWHYEWDGLPEKADGKTIDYTIEEAAVEGYESAITGEEGAFAYTVTNTHAPETTEITGMKAWSDADDQDGLRRDVTSVKLQLKADNAAVGEPVEVTAADGWTHTWKDLAVNRDGGTAIAYTVVEVDAPAGYSADTGNADNGYTVTNAHTPETVSIPVEKRWSDADDQDGLRVPVTVTLLADGTEKGKVDLDASNNWKHVFTGLDKYRDGGVEIAYTVEETAVEGYTPTIAGAADEGFIVTNAHTPEKTTVSVAKDWDDNDDQDGARPDSVTVQLKADSATTGEIVTLDDGNDWSYTWTDLDKYRDGGTAIAYTVEEVDKGGYTPTVSANENSDGTFSYTITNARTPETTEITGTKAWSDADDQDGLRRDVTSVKLQLKADGAAVGEPVEVAADGNWSYTWKGLPKYRDGGTAIAYTVVEIDAPAGYSANTGNADNGYTVTNTHVPAETSATVTKEWDDADNQDGKRAASVSVQLMSNDGAYGNPVTLHAGNGWSYTWQHLPVYQNGEKVAYTVVETDVPDDYTPTVSGSVEEGFVVTNASTPDVRSVSVVKAWDDEGNQDGLRPDSIEVQLLADGAAKGEAVTLSDENHWSYTWTGLDKNRDGGTEIVYTIEEVSAPEGYTTQTTGDMAGGFTVTNIHAPETVSVPVTKAWSDADDQDGVRPEGALLTLYADGEAVASHSVVAGEGWSYTFTDLPKYRDGGTLVKYTVGESNVDGHYTDAVDGFTVTNTHAPETVDVSGVKSWLDADDAAGARPQSVTVYLMADGENIDETTATASGNWAYSFTDLPKYRDGGTLVDYAVVEKPVAGYTSSVDGYDIANTKNAVADFVAVKTLNGRTLSAGEFTFELVQDGEVIQSKTNAGDGYARFDSIEFTPADIGDHSYTIREVAGDANGVAYDETSYDVTATVAQGEDGSLAISYTGYNPELGAEFVNTYTPTGDIDLGVTKLLDGAAPEAGAFTFQLADPTGKVHATATNDANGMVRFPALTFHAAGKYKYLITEVVPEGAQTLGGNAVFGGVAYDETSVGVTIEAIDNFDGSLRFNVSYDGDDATFENTSVPDAVYPLNATKLIEGRDFKAGDEFTFTVSADEGAPLPANTSVTIAPTSGDEAVVSFGDIAFTTADLGKTYTYTVSEQGAGTTADGLTNDPFAHTVELTVGDAGDGTMRVDAEYEESADGIVFTNTYAASGEAVLTATKMLDGRDLAANEFYFELTGDKLPADTDALRAGAAADGSISFDPITFTQADAGKSFNYTISEVKGTLGGVTYDEGSYGVTVSVSDNGDGTLAIAYDYGAGASAPVFRNAYRAEGTSAALEAHKMLVGGTLEGGEFSFTLTGASENAAGVSQTATNDADGLVKFGALDYDAAGTYEYRIAEVVPAGATDNGDGTSTGADGIVYDNAVHTATVTVTDDGYGKLVAEVSYDGGATAVSFGNTALARTGFEFNKYFFGGMGTFDFTLTAVDASGIARSGSAADYSDAATIVDDGRSAFTATVQNGAFDGDLSRVVFPEISYTADGEYHYLIAEAESSVEGMVADAAQYLAHVSVSGGAVVSTTYDLLYDGENLGATDDLSFYNNSAVTLGFDSLSAQSYVDAAQRASVYPKAKKYLNGSTDQLVGGEFTFELVDGITGKTLALATNDETGNIAFFDEDTDPGLAYSEPGRWRYYIREVAGAEAGMVYDDSIVTLTVDVEQTDDGLVATATYNGPGGAEPAFYNVKEGMDITVRKVSRYGGEGLADCTYALWMVGPGGDALVKEATSDADGYITFTDVALMSGQLYYFKEVEAPVGHTVDPYRTAYFTLNAAGDALVLAEETAADGWHSATENRG